MAGTMAHEMAHCVHQNHDQQFYKLMEEILDEHATNQVDQNRGFLFGGRQALGSTENGTSNSSGQSLGNVESSGGQRLGGGGGGTGSGRSRLLTETSGRKLGGGAPQQLLSRREAMARAAESRMRLMQQTRIRISRTKEPCIIELLDDDDSEEDAKETTNVNGASTSKRAPSSKVNDDTTPVPKPRPKRIKEECIDLTSPITKETSQSTPTPTVNPIAGSTGPWICSRCTLKNEALVLVCSACLQQRS